MSAFINMTEAQMSALECAGVFEGDEPLAKFISGKQIQATEECVRLVCELSNHLDELGHGNDGDAEQRKWYRRDAVVLGNLYSKILKKAA